MQDKQPVFSNGNSMGLNFLQWPRKSQVKILAFYRLQTISQTSHSLWLVASNCLETVCGWERVSSGVGGIGCGRRRDSLDRRQEKCVLNLLSQVWRVSQHIHRHGTQEPEIPVQRTSLRYTFVGKMTASTFRTHRARGGYVDFTRLPRVPRRGETILRYTHVHSFYILCLYVCVINKIISVTLSLLSAHFKELHTG